MPLGSPGLIEGGSVWKKEKVLHRRRESSGGKSPALHEKGPSPTWKGSSSFRKGGKNATRSGGKKGIRLWTNTQEERGVRYKNRDKFPLPDKGGLREIGKSCESQGDETPPLKMNVMRGRTMFLKERILWNEGGGGERQDCKSQKNILAAEGNF